MKRYIIKSDLIDLEQIQVNIAWNDILLLVAEKREFLVSLGILVEVDV